MSCQNTRDGGGKEWMQTLHVRASHGRQRNKETQERENRRYAHVMEETTTTTCCHCHCVGMLANELQAEGCTSGKSHLMFSLEINLTWLFCHFGCKEGNETSIVVFVFLKRKVVLTWFDSNRLSTSCAIYVRVIAVHCKKESSDICNANGSLCQRLAFLS